MLEVMKKFVLRKRNGSGREVEGKRNGSGMELEGRWKTWVLIVEDGCLVTQENLFLACEVRGR